MSEEHPAIPAVETPAATTAAETPAAAPEPVTGETAGEPQATPAEQPAAAEVPAEPAVKAHTEEKSLLSGLAEAGEKPAETAAVEAAPAEPVAEPIAYEFEIPEGFSAPPEERMTELRSVLNEAKVPPEAAGKLWSLYTKAAAEQAAAHLQAQHDTFGEMRRGWQTEIMADPQLGGAGFKTNQAAAARMMEMFVAPEHRQKFEEMLVTTGAGDHPALLRLLVNVARKFDEPQAKDIPANPQPPRTPAQVRQAVGAPQRRGGIPYTHPRGGNR